MTPGKALEIDQRQTSSPKRVSAFYRPEFDALRFFAFLSIFLFHGPHFTATVTMSSWRHIFVRGYDWVTHGFGASLPLFFLLSSYLISELLLRESRKTGTIHLKAFYMRRILRIWPLYYFGVACAVALSLLAPHHYHVSRRQIFYFTVFVGWLAGTFNGNPMGPLWSISVEEVFYLIWPGLIKWGGERTLALGSGIVIVASLFFAGYLNNWYNPLSHFVFFATGAVLALAFHQTPSFRLAAPMRAALLLVGVAAWGIGTPIAGDHPTLLHGVFEFAWMDVGCVAIFLAFYDLPKDFFPRWSIYLGQISYGLYVFHLAAQFAVVIMLGRLGLNVSRWPVVVLALAISMLLAVTLAAASYRWLERPFLRLKERFTFIKSGASPAQT